MLILTNNHVMFMIAGQGQHFLKISEGPFSHEAGHVVFLYYVKSNASSFCEF